ncbi:MAG: rod shape-determining protein MreC, partial [Deltaproteobacteria bacterium]|nr:rod shape-determining protein MreC [Deltaproteobacteria bacterium]
MLSTLKRYRILIVSIALGLLALHSAVVERKVSDGELVAVKILSLVSAPLNSAINGAYGTTSRIWNSYITLVGVKKENSSLRQTIDSLKVENERLEEKLRETTRLKTLLSLKDALSFHTIAAGVSDIKMRGWSKTMRLDKGSVHNIKEDMAVISPVGVVGRIISASGTDSDVLLLTDPRSSIDVIVQRTRVRGMAEGNGDNALALKYVMELDDVHVGDVILTAGGRDIFPKGLAVGIVTKVEKGEDNFFKYIEVKPYADVRSLE